MVRRLIVGWMLLLPLLAVARVEQVSVVALFNQRAMVLVDGRQHLLREGEKSPEGVTLLQADSSGAVVLVNGKELRLGLENRIARQYVAAERVNEVVILPDPNGMYRTSGKIDGQTVDFLVDTGATLVSISAVQADKLRIPYKTKGRLVATQTAAGLVSGYMLTLPSVTVGTITLKNVEGSVLEGSHPPIPLLGQSFLSRLKMEQDGRSLRLKE